MNLNEEAFLQRYNELNRQQQEAVDTIYGPVMVVAGPGTGKTEVLSMRIAHLLRSEAQVQPHEILCLTYTDEAAGSMRRRLTDICGSDAHKINIYTFHGFCNSIIQNHSEYFSHRTLQPITDLERTEILYEILDELPQGHPLRKLSGDIYFDTGRLYHLFDLMKRENLSPESVSESIKAYTDDLPNREKYIYKVNGKGYKKGDRKQSLIDKETRSLETTRAAAFLIDRYHEKMQEIGRYDFNDMLLWVLDALKNNEALLQTCQERFQFILVDEFQDTNGAQNELLKILTASWDEAPNIFVVGDDDQSIYEFQGARIRNITEFYDRYRKNIKVIVLPYNYRSSQAILDKAAATIENNRQRLIYQLSELSLNKNILAAHPRFKEEKEHIAPLIKVFPGQVHEEADIVFQIETLKEQGIELSEIAVIYAQHKQASNIMALMERKGIPYSVKKPVNTLEIPLIRQILLILQYLQMERRQPFSGEAVLFEMLHEPFFEAAPSDLALISLYIQQNRKKNHALNFWRMILSNPLLLESLNLKAPESLQRIGNNLENWLGQESELSLPLLIEKLMHESGIVAYTLKGKDAVWNTQALYSFFSFVKEASDREPHFSVSDLLTMVERMKNEQIALPLQRIIQAEDGVQFYTAHGAKGNEFEYVFLIGVTKNFWEGRQGGNFDFRLPDSITRTEEDPDKSYKTEVARRLFYVALTRAKKHLQVSYALKDPEGKDREPSVFIEEISHPEERIFQPVAESALMEHMKWALSPVPAVRIKMADYRYIEKLLQNFTMSYTTLSKYLKCPVGFYYECILKVPFLKNDALSFGSAVHFALEKMFLSMQSAGGIFPTSEEVIKSFDAFMYRERDAFTNIQFERRKEQGHIALRDYYNNYLHQFSKNVAVELKVPRYLIEGIPVTGKIDKIEFDGSLCTVVDYKTGNPDRSATALTSRPNDKNPLGGDYWRQMVFYKMLLENWQGKDWKVKIGLFDFIEKGKTSGEYKRVYIPVYEEDEQIVKKQLKDAWSRIMNHEFDHGCGKPDCYWCNFARNYQLLRPDETPAVIEIDDL